MTESKLRPLSGFVLIQPLEEEEVTASGLALPERAKEKPAKGQVLACGNMAYEVRQYLTDSEKYYPEVEVGKIVIFHKWSGQEIKEGDKTLILVKFSDLQGYYEV